MQQQTPHNPENSRLARTLGDEEEAWYRQDESMDSIAAIREELRIARIPGSSSGSPLADDEDAWAQRP